MSLFRLTSVLSVFLVALLSAAGNAQFLQYQEPGEFGERTESTKEVLEEAIESARWRLGRAYLHPWFSLVDLSYIDNVGGQVAIAEESDVTATLGAGLRGYLPIGSDLFLAAHILPEYVWWNRLSGRNRLNGRYGLGLFGSVRGVGLELSVKRAERAQYFSRELEDRVNSLSQTVDFTLEAPVVGGMSFFVGGSARELRFEEDDRTLLGYSNLDRDELAGRVGFRYQTSRGFSIGLGVESATSDFEEPAFNFSSSGLAPLLELHYDSPTQYLHLELANRELEARNGSSFPSYDGVTGEARLAWRLIPPLEVQLYANRNLAYSINVEAPYFEDTSVGIAAQISLGRLAGIRLFGETGELDFEDLSFERDRLDDFEAFGAELQLHFGRINLFLGTRRTDYESNIPGLDRTVTVTTTGVSFGGRRVSEWG